MLRDVAAGGVFDGDPFVLVDVGCSLGLDSIWRLFGDNLYAHAFDPQLDEIERLRRKEANPNVQYHAAFVGLPDEPPAPPDDPYFNPFGRTSAMQAVGQIAASGATFEETNDWSASGLATIKVGLGDFLRTHGVPSVDFIKTDTDGGDLDVLRSIEETIESLGVLGFMIETPYIGSASETVHTFHNVDRVMKRHGFLLAALSVNRYSRAALPAPFVYEIPAQTVWGQPMWGDLVYLREGAHPGYAHYGELSPTKFLKLACLHELFGAPDCAAEILIAQRDHLSAVVDVDRMLDLLTPPLHGVRLSYRDYLAAFERDPTQFYPKPPMARAPVSSVNSLVARMRRR